MKSCLLTLNRTSQLNLKNLLSRRLHILKVLNSAFSFQARNIPIICITHIHHITHNVVYYTSCTDCIVGMRIVRKIRNRSRKGKFHCRVGHSHT